MTIIHLPGCRPEPLASYLKALAVLRLVSEQKDASARGHWSPAGFVLTTRLTVDELCCFLLDEYAPTPIVSPWNGASGFGLKGSESFLEVILASDSPRLAEYRNVIRRARAMGPLTDSKGKDQYLTRLRNSLPDSALPWLDAAVVLAEDGARFPILLGTGGNDGRLDFSANFMQRLADALCLGPPRKSAANPSPGWLQAALFANNRCGLVDAAVGQFDPGGAGGSNSSPQGKGKSLVNAWDFVLMMEGAVVFAGAAVRRRPHERQSVSVPFSFHPTGAGYASATVENGRGEVWAPLWADPARLSSVQSLFQEGRVTWNGRLARDGLEAVRAIATLQIDRRIDEFVRFSITERFGLSYVAVPVGRVEVPERARGDIAVTASLDPWLHSVRSIGDRATPAGIASRLRNVEAALVEQARSPLRHGAAARLFDALERTAALERSVARSRNARERVRPIGGIHAADWLPHLRPLMHGSVEFRLAWALASGFDSGAAEDVLPTLRELFLPIRAAGGRWQWADSPAIDGIESAPVAELLAAAASRRQWLNRPRRPREDAIGSRLCSAYGARPRPADLAVLASGAFDRPLLARFLRALLVLDFRKLAPQDSETANGELLGEQLHRQPAIDALSAATLAHCGPGSPALPVPAGLVAQLAADSPGAVTLLARSVRIAGFDPQLPASTGGRGPWLAACLLLNGGPGIARYLAAAGYRDAERARLTNQPDSAKPADVEATAGLPPGPSSKPR